MVFPWILQKYIFREMRNTFLLTTAGLTVVFSLGGGVLNMIRLGEVTPSQFVRLMLLVIPFGASLTLPVAALFSASSAYGRISADNEFVACRSSGINLHTLFLPTLILSLFSALVTFLFLSYLIPVMVGRLQTFVMGDIGTIVRQQLKRSDGVRLSDRYRVHADESYIDLSDPDCIFLRGVAMVETNGDDWVRYGTARQVDLRIDRDVGTIGGTLYGLRLCDQGEGCFYDTESQSFDPTAIPSKFPKRIKFLTLGELWSYRTEPERWDPVQEAFDSLRSAVGHRMIYNELIDQWRQNGVVRVGDNNLNYTLSPEKPLHEIPRSGGLELEDVEIKEHRRNNQRVFHVNRATIEVVGGVTKPKSGSSESESGNAGIGNDFGIRIDLRGLAGQAQPTNQNPPTSQTLARSTLGPVTVPSKPIEALMILSNDELLTMAQESSDPVGPIVRKSEAARETRTRTYLKIVSTLHERLAFSTSIFVLVILGAALGIIFRGSHLITAFGISFLPALVVLIGIIAGRQMAQNVGTHTLGLGMMWSGIAIVTLLDAWILTCVLRR